MKNKYTLLISALLLSFVMSACSAAGEKTENKTSAASVVSASESETSAAASVDKDDSDAPVTPRITYSKDRYSDSHYIADGKKDIEYDDYAYEFAETDGDYEPAAEAPAAVAPATAKDSAGTVKNAAAPEAPADAAPAPGYKTDDYEIYDDGKTELPDDIIEPMPEIQPEVGLLTAGEWNDNDNWGFFTNLVNSQRIIFPSYGVDPRYRIKVNVLSPDKSAVVNASVDLLDRDENVIWSAVTDKNGTAYLFEDAQGSGYSIRLSDGTNTQNIVLEIDTPVPVSAADPQSQQQEALYMDQVITLNFDGKSTLYDDLDIMFIVDSTGSMSDEMVFLQEEFTAIAEDVGDSNTRYSVNFYRDEGDDYVTKCYDFTKNVTELQKQLNSESANGGGDMPEAVDRILEESITNSNWSKNSVKLAFMIFDAPPHSGTEDSILRSVKAAAAKGIRLIPVVSSNSDRDTELFGRACAITTGGTYVFLTDDSGVGRSHLEPIIGKYDVEKLYDLIIRVIGEYKQNETPMPE